MKKTSDLFCRRNVVKAIMMVFDALAVNLAYFLALVLRYYVTFEFNPDATKFVTAFLHIAPYYGVICVAVFYAFRLYNTIYSTTYLHTLLHTSHPHSSSPHYLFLSPHPFRGGSHTSSFFLSSPRWCGEKERG